jgi:fatty acid desaturase (delta-4 desaturase)
MYPLLRFDTRLPLRPWHKWQHVYIWVAYPFMHLAFQMGDFSALATGRTVGADLLGATWGGEAGVGGGWVGGVGLGGWGGGGGGGVGGCFVR